MKQFITASERCGKRRNNMILKAGDRFRKKNGDICQVTAVATDTRDGSTRLVYQELFGDYRYLVGEPADAQPEQAAQGTGTVAEKSANTGEIKEIFEGEVNPFLLAFLEADTSLEKLDVLNTFKDTTDEKLLSAVEASLDLTGSDATPEERIAFIRSNLSTRARYEGSRLR